MADRHVLIDDLQILTPQEFENIQTFPAEAMKRLVHDAVGDGAYYSGFTAVEDGDWGLDIAPGRLYLAGAIYRRDETVSFDMFQSSIRPTSQKKWVAIVGWGQSIDEDDVRDRQFLVSAQTDDTHSKPTPLLKWYKAAIGHVVGSEAATPVKPSAAAGQVLIAYVLLSTAGIEQIVMVEENLVPQAARNQLANLENQMWRDNLGATIDTVQTDLTAIQEKLTSLMSRREFQEFLKEFDEYKDRTNEALELAHELDSASPAFLFQELETFAHEGLTDKAGAGFASRIERGLRFGFEAENGDQVLSPINPVDPLINITNNFALPAWSSRPRLSTWKAGLTASVALNAYSNVTVSTKTGKRAVYRRVAGAQYVMSVTHKYYNRNYMGAAQTITRNGDTYRLVDNEVVYSSRTALPNGEEYITSQLTYEAPAGNVLSHYENYTYEHTETTDYTGQGRAQTFMQFHDGWIVSVDLYLRSVGTPNDVRVMVVEAPGGVPDLQRAVTETTVAHADLTVGASSVDGGLTVNLEPGLLRAGGRYAVCVLSQGSHQIYTTDTPTAGGTMYHMASNGTWEPDDADSTLAMRLNFAKFRAARVEVDMKPMELTDGFTGTSIWSEQIVPPSCRLDYEVQIGGRWYVLDRDIGAQAAADLSGGDSLLPFRVVFVGSQDIMPGVGIEIQRSGVITSRNATTLRHWSTIRPFGGTANTLRVRVRVANWNAGKHTIDIDIHDGATTIEADTITETDVGGAMRDFVATFDISGSPLTQCQIIIDGTSSDATDLFYGVERRIAAFA